MSGHGKGDPLNRVLLGSLSILGCVLILAGVSIFALGRSVVYAQDDAPEFVGADECASCHRNLARDHAESNHALALQDVSRSRDKDLILGDFEQGEDVRQVLFPGEDTPRAFTDDDIAFAIGAGVHVQGYLYEVDRNEYRVLPAQWNVDQQQWQPYTLADDWTSDAYDWEQNCAYCHVTGFDAERGRWQDDGVQCEACHGPASSHVELAQDAGRRPNDEELVAIRSAIYRSPDPQVCGQCHSQGTDAEQHPYPAGYVPGAALSDFFQLVPEDSADHWWLPGHAKQTYMQYNEWLTSTHATSLVDVQESEFADESCLTCHSQDARQTAALIALVEEGEREGEPLAPLTPSQAQWGVTCTACHDPHTDSGLPGNLVAETYPLCTSCHVNPENASFIHHPTTEMFEGVSLVEGIDGTPGVHFSMEDGPRCATCHMQPAPVQDGTTRITHGFTPVLPGTSDVLLSACEGCHSDLTTTDLTLLVRDTQDAVSGRLRAAQTQLERLTAPEAGSAMLARYEQAVAALDFIQNDGSLGVHNYDYVDTLLTAAEQNLTLLSAPEGQTALTETPTPAPLPSSPVVVVQADLPAEEVPSGVRPITIGFIAGVIIVLLIAAFAFFRRPNGDG